MMQWILFFFMLMFNLIFMFMKHPLTMGLILLIQTNLICFITGLMSKTFWFSYILFLVFIGGMLVLFIYITSLASNEMFNLSMKLLIMYMLMFMMSLLILFYMNNFFMIFKNNETLTNFNLNYYIMENSLSMIKLYNYPNNLLTIMLMNYLLITLIAVVKITKLFKGPLRTMFN